MSDPSDAGSLTAQQLLALWASQVMRNAGALRLEHKGGNIRSPGTCLRTLCTPAPSLVVRGAQAGLRNCMGLNLVRGKPWGKSDRLGVKLV